MPHPIVQMYDLELQRAVEAADGTLKGILRLKKKGVKDNDMAMLQTCDSHNRACEKRDNLRRKREELLADLESLERLRRMLGALMSWKSQLDGDAKNPISSDAQRYFSGVAAARIARILEGAQ